MVNTLTLELAEETFAGRIISFYYPVSGPIPLHRYRTFKHGKADGQSNRIRSLADDLPIAALAGDDVRLTPPTIPVALPRQPFKCRGTRIVSKRASHLAGGD